MTDAPWTGGEWAVVEVMGHRRHFGYVRQVTIAGTPMIEVLVPGDGDAVAGKLRYAGASLFGLHPMTEEEVRRMVAEEPFRVPGVYPPRSALTAAGGTASVGEYYGDEETPDPLGVPPATVGDAEIALRLVLGQDDEDWPAILEGLAKLGQTDLEEITNWAVDVHNEVVTEEVGSRTVTQEERAGPAPDALTRLLPAGHRLQTWRQHLFTTSVRCDKCGRSLFLDRPWPQACLPADGN